MEIWNAWTVERRREDGVVGLGLEWGRAADRLLALAADASEEDWRDRQIPWIAGDLRMRFLVQARVAEWWAHGEDIREGGSLPPRREHWPAFAANDLAIRLTPRSLSRGGFEARGRSVKIDLTGVGGGSWHQSAAPGAVAEGKKPDAFVTGDGYSFASVAVGRADVEVCLYEGLLNLGGDAELAEAMLRGLRAFP